ncbi:MAG: hypothetical protein ACM3SV_08785 [Betaproteobacteria bacterium]
MNVFVLCTGRSGSVTFIKACAGMENFSAAHESRAHAVGGRRLAYPPDHIEADNRLSWMLGRLDEAYGDRACYVHLHRDLLETARSFQARYDRGIIQAYRNQIVMGGEGLNPGVDSIDFCIDYCQTVDANIRAFLKDKTQKMDFSLERAKADFARFWEWIGATGDFEAAMSAWDVRHNATTDARKLAPA